MAVSRRRRSESFPPLPNEPSVSDARLVDAVRRGDRDAFGELVRRYEHRLLAVIRRFVDRPDAAEDLAQETFLRVYQRLDQFDPSRRFGPWLFQIGVNLTLDWLRRRRRWLRLFTERGREPPPDPGIPDPRVQEDLQQEVRHILAVLPEKYRTVLILRDLENFTTSDIAAILNRKETTIRWRLAEARHRFYELWEQRHTG